MTEHRHAIHPDIIKRRNRTEGHLKSVIASIENGKPCLDIAHNFGPLEQPSRRRSES